MYIVQRIDLSHNLRYLYFDHVTENLSDAVSYMITKVLSSTPNDRCWIDLHDGIFYHQTSITPEYNKNTLFDHSRQGVSYPNTWDSLQKYLEWQQCVILGWADIEIIAIEVTEMSSVKIAKLKASVDQWGNVPYDEDEDDEVDEVEVDEASSSLEDEVEETPPSPSPFFKKLNITHYATAGIYADRIPRAIRLARHNPLGPEAFVYRPKRTPVKSVTGQPIEISPSLKAALSRIISDDVIVTTEQISITTWKSLDFCSIFKLLEESIVYQYDEDKYLMLIHVDAESG